MENDKKTASICIKCKALDRSNFGANKPTFEVFECTHPDAVVNDHLMGRKLCQYLNGHGQCKLFKDRWDREEETKSSLGSIVVDLTLNTEPFKKKMAELLAGL